MAEGACRRLKALIPVEECAEIDRDRFLPCAALVIRPFLGILSSWPPHGDEVKRLQLSPLEHRSHALVGKSPNHHGT